jgi:hypothetical protein
MKRSRVLIAAVALVASDPAAASSGRAYHGGTFVGVAPGPAADYGNAYNCRNDRYGYNCRKYGYGCNCPYYQLPDWNGPMEIRNPGG